MTVAIWKRPFIDSLYGEIKFDDILLELIQSPVVQRLRHVRLSNIDSIDIPGISNLSRFEHVLGVAHLASNIEIRPSLNSFDALVLKASALLHDWAITSFGHLVEEALQYVGTAFEHETKLAEMIYSEDSEEIGGINFQIFLGRQTGLKSWAKMAAGKKNVELIDQITKNLLGVGKMGKLISGDIDLDNIDNVFRMAFHMGLDVDKTIPIRLAKSIMSFDQIGPVFSLSSESDIQVWSTTRQKVYQRLMLSERDFVGKLMLLYACVAAYKQSEITKTNWNFVDFNLINALLSSPNKEVKETTQRWLSGELWTCTPLYWMPGNRPSYPELLIFSNELSEALGRQCFAYGIKDKRDRLLTINFEYKVNRQFGSPSNQWLLGVGSSKRAPFNSVEVTKILKFTETFFGCSVKSEATTISDKKDDQACLF